MDISYKRTQKDSYMIVTTKEYISDYEEKMLKENEIRVLLSFCTMEVNGAIQFWYDISGKQSLKDYLQQKELTYDCMEEILLYLVAAYEEIHKYLLHEEKVSLCPETIYVARQGQFRVFLCYCPFLQETEGTIADIMEYILAVVDHQEESLMRTCYEMYNMALQEGTTLYDLLCHLQEKMKHLAPQQKKVEVMEDFPEIEKKADEEVESFKEDKPAENEAEEIYYESSYERLLEQIRQKGQHIKELICSWFSQSKAIHGTKNDVVIEPEPVEIERTVLLNQSTNGCEGRLLYQGSAEESDYYIKGEVFRIGSEEMENDACLHSVVVSRHHARITRHKQEFYIEDLNSTNGTYVNGILLEYTKKQKLQPMDRVIFADVEYLFV